MSEAACSEDGCDRVGNRRGMCGKHYLRWWRAQGKVESFAGMKCRTDGCERPAGARSGKCRPCYLRDWEQDNADVIRERRAAHYAANADRWAQNAARYRRENPERFREANRRWREANPERVRQIERDSAARNPERRALQNREKSRRRRALTLTNGVDLVDYAAILEEFGMFCHICVQPIASLSDLHMDHVVPLAKGGPHDRDNIRPAHATCNLRKGDRIA